MQTSIHCTIADDGTATVTVRGEIDFANAGDLARALSETVAEHSPTLLLVDLRQAGFIDSTGLGALIEGYRAALTARTRFVVVDPTPSFRRVLTVTGLDEFFGLAEAGTAQTQATGA